MNQVDLEKLVSAVEQKAVRASREAGRTSDDVKLRYSSLSSFLPRPRLMLIGVNAAGTAENHKSEARARALPDYWAYLDEDWLRGGGLGGDNRQLRIQASALAALGWDPNFCTGLVKRQEKLDSRAEKALRAVPAIQLWPFRSADRPELMRRWPALYQLGPSLALEIVNAVRPRIVMALGKPPYDQLCTGMSVTGSEARYNAIAAVAVQYPDKSKGILLRIAHPSQGWSYSVIDDLSGLFRKG